MDSVYCLRHYPNVSCHPSHLVFGGKGTSLRLGGGRVCGSQGSGLLPTKAPLGGGGGLMLILLNLCPCLTGREMGSRSPKGRTVEPRRTGPRARLNSATNGPYNFRPPTQVLLASVAQSGNWVPLIPTFHFGAD